VTSCPRHAQVARSTTRKRHEEEMIVTPAKNALITTENQPRLLKLNRKHQVTEAK